MMKKILLVMLLFSASFTTFAQNENVTPKPFTKHEFMFSIGDPFWWNIGTNFFNYHYLYDQSWLRPDQYTKWDITLPSFTVSYLYRPLKWLWVGANISYSGYSEKICDLITNEKLGNKSSHAIALSPYIRFSYFNREKVNLYSGIGIGIYTLFQSNPIPPHPPLRFSTNIAYQLTFFGVTFGKKLVGSAELGFGYKGIFNMGIGYHF